MTTSIGIQDSNQKIITNGLRLYIDAGQLRSYARGGTTAWNDLSGFGNNFTIYNGGVFSTNYRGEIQFDGVNDYARLRSSTSLPTNDGTIEIWIRSLTNGDNFGTAAYGRAISMSDTTGTGSDTGGSTASSNDYINYYCLLKNNTADNLSHLFARDINGPNTGGVGFYPFSNAGYVTADALYRHIVITWSSSGSTRSFSSYVNNVNNGNNNYTYNLFLSSTMSTVTLAMECGGSNLSPIGPVKCAIGAFRLYNRKLSTTEVAQNWQVERARFGR